MSDDRRDQRSKRRPRSVMGGEWSSEPPAAEPMYPSDWTLERELRGEGRQPVDGPRVGGDRRPPERTRAEPTGRSPEPSRRAPETTRRAAEQARRAQVPPGPSGPPPPPPRPTGPTGPPPRPARPASPHRPSAGGPSNRSVLRQALSSRRATRQALLLREVLGPPVSLRTPTDDRPV